MATKRKGHEMASAYHEQIEFGARVSWWLRLSYRTSTAKRVARDFDISERQAKRWLAGERPTPEHIECMARKFGWRFIDFVFEGIAGPPRPVEIMRTEMDELDQRLARLERERLDEDARGVALQTMGVARVATTTRFAPRGVGGEVEAKAVPVARGRR